MNAINSVPRVSASYFPLVSCWSPGRSANFDRVRPVLPPLNLREAITHIIPRHCLDPNSILPAIPLIFKKWISCSMYTFLSKLRPTDVHALLPAAPAAAPLGTRFQALPTSLQESGCGLTDQEAMYEDAAIMRGCPICMQCCVRNTVRYTDRLPGGGTSLRALQHGQHCRAPSSICGAIIVDENFTTCLQVSATRGLVLCPPLRIVCWRYGSGSRLCHLWLP